MRFKQSATRRFILHPEKYKLAIKYAFQRQNALPSDCLHSPLGKLNYLRRSLKQPWERANLLIEGVFS